MSLCICILSADSIYIAADGRRGACIKDKYFSLYDYDRKLTWINEQQMLFVGGMTIPSENVKCQVFERLTLKGYDMETSLKIISEICREQHDQFKHLVEDDDFLTTTTALFAAIFDGKPIIAGFSTVNNFEPQILSGLYKVCVRGFLDKEAIRYFSEKYIPGTPINQTIFSTFAHCSGLDNRVGGLTELFKIGSSGIEMFDQCIVSKRQIKTSSTDSIEDALQTSHIGNGVILQAHIGNAQVVTAAIGDLAVNTAKIADLAVTTTKIADLAVTNAKITSLSADKLTAGTIDASIITVTNINANEITTGSLSASQISGGTLSGVTISVTTDANIGNKIYIGDQESSSVGKGIYLSSITDNACSITKSAGTSSLLISSDRGLNLETGDEYYLNISSGGLRVSLQRPFSVVSYSNDDCSINTNGTLKINSATGNEVILPSDSYLGSNLIATRAWVDDQNTSYVSNHNHGIPNGTVLVTSGGGTVTWSASGGHRHNTTDN